MSMRNNFRFLPFIALLIAFGLNGCRTTSTSPSSTSSGSSPAVGSTFTYKVVQYDIDNFTPLTIDTVTATLTGTQPSFEGAQNVVEFSNAGAFNGSDLVYASNSDVSVYVSESQPYNGIPQWVNLPFSGDAGSRVVFYSGDSVTDVASSKYGPQSSSTLLVGSKVVDIYESEIVDSTMKKTSYGGTSIYFQTSSYWFSPSLGAMTSVTIGWYTNAITGVEVGNKVATLIGATIK